ncbi:type II toxin-antitoxin system RelE/ParE family toxin [Gracilinema caldarium]|uniref:Plasmid stabilization system n=1 Tax=Gracilinema caldarium (strain ATCC 51460 / DSM 7334 / H1) TaxID=744872 RepID=F8F042_GRAC1|nr:type II toxin-antitoxin system RelE/ParE family toxin [Gracilinema caldarium]AEJ18695.1 plasmid stabilization system [Gracilinema caldarium DSM 7334]
MYTLQFTEPAEHDLLSILTYITEVLKAPDSAKQLVADFEKQTELLKTAPLCCALVSDDYLRSKGIRALLVKKYYLFYVVNEEESLVSVIRILYSRRDWSNILRNDNTYIKD